MSQYTVKIDNGEDSDPRYDRVEVDTDEIRARIEWDSSNDAANLNDLIACLEVIRQLEMGQATLDRAWR